MQDKKKMPVTICFIDKCTLSCIHIYKPVMKGDYDLTQITNTHVTSFFKA